MRFSNTNWPYFNVPHYHYIAGTRHCEPNSHQSYLFVERWLDIYGSMCPYGIQDSAVWTPMPGYSWKYTCIEFICAKYLTLQNLSNPCHTAHYETCIICVHSNNVLGSFGVTPNREICPKYHEPKRLLNHLLFTMELGSSWDFSENLRTVLHIRG